VTRHAKLTCPECGKPMILRTSRFGPFYGCTGWPDCECTHGAHPDGSPLGTPADRATREARTRAHEAFDALWAPNEGEGSRTRRKAAYAQLQVIMGMNEEQAHIGKFTLRQCEVLVARLEELRHGDDAR